MDQEKQKMNPKWHPPAPGVVKLNVDDAFEATDNQGATGVVIRDEMAASLQFDVPGMVPLLSC